MSSVGWLVGSWLVSIAVDGEVNMLGEKAVVAYL
jgi:hypothetical protein